MATDEEEAAATGRPSGSWPADLAACVRFFTRLPVPGGGSGAPDFSRAWRAAPLAGALVGALAGAVLALLSAIGLDNAIAAAAALAVWVAVTGALHEDGLADIADGFGGGRDPARKLEIMRDSRVGTYGVAAIGLSLLIRFAVFGVLAAQTGMLAPAALIASGAVSRWLAVAVPMRLPTARPDGLGARSGAIARRPFVQATVVTAVVAGLCAVPVAGAGGALVATFASGVAFYALCALARRQIGGYTGDVIGAVQQVTEIVFLVALTLFL